jgi:hypothetical protein
LGDMVRQSTFCSELRKHRMVVGIPVDPCILLALATYPSTNRFVHPRDALILPCFMQMAASNE